MSFATFLRWLTARELLPCKERNGSYLAERRRLCQVAASLGAWLTGSSTERGSGDVARSVVNRGFGLLREPIDRRRAVVAGVRKSPFNG